MGHRYYDPGTGRFLTRDPLGYGGGADLYGFTGNNPVNESDSWGLSEDAGGGAGTLRLSLAAFIPQAEVYVEVPHVGFTVAGFLGDNRNFSSHSKDYRIEQNVVVNFRNDTVHILSGKVGTSHAVKGLGIYLNGYTGTASNDNMSGSYTKDSSGNFYIINLSGSVGIPAFHGTAPPIEYNLRITVNRLTQQVWSITGGHTRFPALELYSYKNRSASRQLFGYDPRRIPIGPDPGLRQHTRFSRFFF